MRAENHARPAAEANQIEPTVFDFLFVDPISSRCKLRGQEISHLAFAASDRRDRYELFRQIEHLVHGSPYNTQHGLDRS